MAYVRDEDYRPDDRPGGDSVRSAILKIASGESDPGSSALDDVYAHLNELRAAVYDATLPGQEGSAGKFLKSDGTDNSWEVVTVDDIDGLDQSGNAGKFLKTDGADPAWEQIGISDVSGLRDELDSAGAKFIASGDIDGAGIALVRNPDDTVSAVSSTPAPPGIVDTDDIATFTATAYATKCIYDPGANRYVVLMTSAGGGTKAAVGTVSGATITFGTPVAVSAKNTGTLVLSGTYDSINGKIVVAYEDAVSGYNKIHVRVGTVSGDTITFGTALNTNYYAANAADCTFDVENAKVIMAANSTSHGQVHAFTVSGNSITQDGFISVLYCKYYIGCAYVGAGKTVIAYRNNLNNGAAAVCTVSGSTITLGTPTEFTSVSSSYFSCEAVGDKALITFYADGSGTGGAMAGTISGTDITFPLPTTFDSGPTRYISTFYDSPNSRLFIAYADNTSSMRLVSGVVSGETLTFSDPVIVGSFNPLTTGLSYDASSDRVILATRSATNSYVSTAYLVRVEDETVTDVGNFIGFSQSSAADAESVGVATKYAVDGNQTGLSQGTEYWLDYDGSLSTSDLGYPKAGTAITSTQIMVGV